MTAGCAQLEPILALPKDQSSDAAPAAAVQPAAPKDDNWVPPQPFPGKTSTVGKRKIPLPAEKPQPADETPVETVAEEGPTGLPSRVATLAPDDIVGMNQARVASTLGPPFARAEKPPARVWQYRGVDCILSVRFFLDLNDQSFRALSVDAAKTDGEKDAPERCIAQVMAARR